jgi:hypothetical protein
MPACDLKDLNRCEVCARVMCRPVFLPACGHSPCCQACAIATKIKKCGRCGQSVKTPPARLKVNMGMSSLLRCLWPEEFADDRPCDDALLHEIQRKAAVVKLDSAISRAAEPGPYYSSLQPTYRAAALGLIDIEHSGVFLGTHVLRWCECGLVEIPRFSKKSGRHFFGCPAWAPMSCKRKRLQESDSSVAVGNDDSLLVPEDMKYCGSFAHISKKQREALKLN